jgi:hypothetical protein
MLPLNEQKPFLAEHLPYELAMLEFTYQRFEALTVPSAEFNVFLEAFCIHARNLKWFLTRNSDGVRALDFVAGYSVRVDNLASVFNRINDNVSHIFRHRLKGKKFTLHDATLAYDWLKNEMEGFRKALAPAQQTMWGTSVGRHDPTATNMIRSVASTSAGVDAFTAATKLSEV